MPEKKEKLIGEWVAENFRTAEVFSKYGIDYCCGGKRSIADACLRKGINPNDVIKELSSLANSNSNIETDYNSWDLTKLVDHILEKHHQYINNSTPILRELSQKVARVHGDAHPELILIAQNTKDILDELQVHMMKEEHMLFPYIKTLSLAQKTGIKPDFPAFGTIRNPLNMMEAEHVSAGNLGENIRNLSNNFQYPFDACTSYKVLFLKLEEFEKDLHQHIHLENNILFAKSILLEDELFRN